MSYWRLVKFSNLSCVISNQVRTRQNCIYIPNSQEYLGRYTRGSLFLKHAPETRSRVSTPTSTHEGHDGVAEWWNNPIGAWDEKKKKKEPIWLANWRHVVSREANFSTHQGACSWNRLVQQICPWSLLPRIKPVWYKRAKLGSKSFVAQHIFSLEIVGADEGALLRERVAGACCGSKVPRVYRSF